MTFQDRGFLVQGCCIWVGRALGVVQAQPWQGWVGQELSWLDLEKAREKATCPGGTSLLFCRNPIVGCCLPALGRGVEAELEHTATPVPTSLVSTQVCKMPDR